MRWIATPALLLALLDAGQARAYVPYRTEAGKDFFWQASCVPITVYQGDFTGMTTNEIAKSVAAAAHTWSPDDVTCPDGVSHPSLEIVPTMAAGGTASVKDDARNVLIFQTANWVHAGEALALTTIFTRLSGKIVGADIELNATPGTTWMNLDNGPVAAHGLTVYDLQNTLTHEFGHFIGLDHTCFIAGSLDPTTGKDKLPPVDYLGVAVPDCDFAPPEVQATVMYPKVFMLQETSKRVLSPDEILAVCSTYPAGTEAGVCEMDQPNDVIGCTTAATPGISPRARPAATVGAVLAALALGALRRRQRRRHPRPTRTP